MKLYAGLRPRPKLPRKYASKEGTHAMQQKQSKSKIILSLAYILGALLVIVIAVLLITSAFTGHGSPKPADSQNTPVHSGYAVDRLRIWSIEDLPAAEAFLTEKAAGNVESIRFVGEPKKTLGSQQLALQMQLMDGTIRIENTTLVIDDPAITWELGTDTDPKHLLGEAYADAVPEKPISEFMQIGVYTVNIKLKDGVVPFQLTVQDTTAPVVTLVDPLSFYINQELRAEDFVASCTDATEVTYTLSAVPDTSKNGTFSVKLTATDAAGNKSDYDISYTVTGDGDAPVISGTEKMQTLKGIPVNYLRGVTAEDAKDGATEVTAAEPEGFSIDTAGTYKITYTSVDAAGNKAEVTADLVVYDALSDADALTETDVYRMGDAIVRPMLADTTLTQKQLARKLYVYVQAHMFYKDNKDIKEWHIGAAVALYRGYGDCRNYYDFSKLLYDCAGFESMMVEHTPATATAAKHFWNLVKIDGEWYHCDSTPRHGRSDFFMLTDAEMDYYSSRNGNCFARDKSLYPATPTRS